MIILFNSICPSEHHSRKELFPAIRCNLFIFKGKIKRISTDIGARELIFITIFKLQTQTTRLHQIK
jgi:hypothetical protein